LAAEPENQSDAYHLLAAAVSASQPAHPSAILVHEDLVEKGSAA
jgi:hypothetical protein